MNDIEKDGSETQRFREVTEFLEQPRYELLLCGLLMIKLDHKHKAQNNQFVVKWGMYGMV